MYKAKDLFVVAIYGSAGVGKSTLAESVKNELVDTAHVSSDHIKRYISQFKEVNSHNAVSRKVTNVMIVEYLKNGINTIVEQGMDQNEVEILEKIAQENHANFYVYKLEAEHDTQLLRLQERARKTNIAVMSDETLHILDTIYKDNEYQNVVTFNSDTLSVEEMKERILKDLNTMPDLVH